MILFEFDSQHREKLTIWRVFSHLGLFGPLASGHIFRWFAINIPMRIGTETSLEFTSDLDIIACLRDSHSKSWMFKTWEVKVSLLDKNGVARSLKGGKLKRTLNQLKAYKAFGADSTTLLDVYICENGFLKNHFFPTEEVFNVNKLKIPELQTYGFGYQTLVFEHGKEGDDDIGLYTPVNIQRKSVVDILMPRNYGHRQPFSRLVDDISKFFDNQGEVVLKSFNQIVYCKNCRKFQLINMKEIF